MDDVLDNISQKLTVIAQMQAQQTGGTSAAQVSRVIDESSSSVQNSSTVNRDVTNEITKNVTNDITRNVDVHTPNDENTGIYFSSGSTPIVLSDTTEWKRFDFGVLATAVNIRSTDEIEITYQRPDGGLRDIIHLSNKALPFSDGGQAGVGSAFLWVRKAESASSNPEVQVIAR
jgi:hypothetical protein